ncbi:hypothetical protein CEUSTIGMA_g8864.t1 [Chlamydomonas eustigma]|uniref:Guanylate cyclase domain-containing protein n=1 Tax=Chlamydomonas eustigma TaxID=1157962 RepID=A0A250XEC4_9CHLO|nr:hypothetical protein CEUSTIGMA_g8864.t1 [Chlamydomonas eustigma]|eukprot:GAX81434.1 hypothetical protein CEUSTIGMA_g8864.t1 [Chlamydomonas eustigma]
MNTQDNHIHSLEFAWNHIYDFLGLGEVIMVTVGNTGSVLLASLAGAGATCAAFAAIWCLKYRLTSEQESDFALFFLAVATPVLLLAVRFNPLPTSDDSKANCVITFAFLLRLGSLLDLSPPYSMAQVILSYPIFTFLDFHRRCNRPLTYPETCSYFFQCNQNYMNITSTGPLLQACRADTVAHCCSASSFLHHMTTRGVFMLVVGVIAVLVPILISLKHRKEVKGESDERETTLNEERGNDEQDAAEYQLLPFEACGVHILAALGLRGPFREAEAMLSTAADYVSEFLLVSVVCFPIGFYYFGYSLLSRVMPKIFSIDAVTSDEWLLGLSVFFVLGRESCKVDMMPSIRIVQEQLKTSQEILQDVMPQHIIDLMVSQSPARMMRAAAATAASAGKDSLTRPPSSIMGGAVGDVQDVLEITADHDDGEDLDLVRRSGSTTSSVPGSVKSSITTVTQSVAGSLSRIRPLVGGGISTARCPAHAAAGGPAGVGGWGRGSSAPTQHSGSPLSSSTLGPAAGGGGVNKFSHAESHDCVTIFFSDIVGFSTWAHELPAAKVMDTLNDLYSRLDDILLIEMPSLYKVETIGDAYMVAANLVTFDAHHAATMVRFALRVQQEAAKVLRPDCSDGSTLQLRMGIHSGPAVSGVMGKVRRRFNVLGDTVNLASRCENSCPPGCIQLTEKAYQLANPDISNEVVFRDRGEVEVKEAGASIRMYLAISKQVILATRGLMAVGMEL